MELYTMRGEYLYRKVSNLGRGIRAFKHVDVIEFHGINNKN